ncbi:MAG: sigma-70 family RNA polymerase sigma factor, partial [Gemmatimonadetes bacterium]|nr:sigma-70 family RNA polymerase sigma factor [Gemmatimonadota bacterium]
ARNLALDEIKRTRIRTTWARAAGLGIHADREDPLPSAELRAEVEAAIGKLAPRRREVFHLARYHGFSYREIAQAMGISVQTVANHMSAALADLRKSLLLPAGAILPT